MIALAAVCLFGKRSEAQDHIYSQFFNEPVYLNPALNGQFKGDLRVNMIYRNQWTNSPAQLSYFTASLDYQIPAFAGGVGLMVTHSAEGSAYLTKNNISGIYSYSVGTQDYVLSFGVQAGLTNRKIDYNRIIFADQIDPRLGYDPGLPTAAEPPAFNSRYMFDAGAGMNLVVRNFMTGYSLQHINKPDESFTGTPSLMARRHIAYASFRFALNRYNPDDDSPYLVPSVVYYRQASSSSVSGGVQFKQRSVSIGVWYRTNVAGQSDAVVGSVIFDLFGNRANKNSKVRLGASHDATLSRLNYSNTSGTTEASLGYEVTFPNRDPYRKLSEAVRCYDFY
ncbi:type IX secretion system membrane protein PorP/SprF [Pedobacter sp. HMF7056]|uniref:Type IX secretion system membrane protein PorP/SprF n=2 Tax=Hufsiella ginkgonis TaxID=2695274 RepID=A0A7K1XSE1_9SPHI|nr:type IX secretion system membrane protein PorP/SprF [Hufsiella ginkgonis]